MLAQIGTLDITPYIQESTYSINSFPISISWMDGNYKTHWDVVREKVAGSFELVFITQSDFNNFLSALAAVTSGGISTISLDVKNKGTYGSYRVHYDLESILDREISSTNAYKRYTMTLEEE